MHDFLTGSTFFSVALTVGAFCLGAACQKKWKLALLNPILIGAALVMLTLTVFNIPLETYQAGCAPLSYLMTPATICLAISFAQQLQALKRHLPAVFLGVLAGVVCSLGSIALMCRVFGFSQVLTHSLLPKSITTAIGVALSEQVGGLSAITTAAIVVTGILGNILGPWLCKLFRLRDPIAQGVAYGTASHVIGTSRAVAAGELAGAVSSLSLTLAGVLTSGAFSILFAK